MIKHYLVLNDDFLFLCPEQCDKPPSRHQACSDDLKEFARDYTVHPWEELDRSLEILSDVAGQSEVTLDNLLSRADFVRYGVVKVCESWWCGQPAVKPWCLDQETVGVIELEPDVYAYLRTKFEDPPVYAIVDDNWVGALQDLIECETKKVVVNGCEYAHTLYLELHHAKKHVEQQDERIEEQHDLIKNQQALLQKYEANLRNSVP